MALRLPAPMLARSGSLPTSEDWAFEVKWDGFRAVVRTGRDFRARSRRGWDMTALVPELRALPVDAVLDGELVAFEAGAPHFPLVCDRLLHGDDSVPLWFVPFDVLELGGESLLARPWRERRRLLEELDLNGPSWFTAEVFDDGAELFAAVQQRGMEGVVAKRRGGFYRPAERGWVKVKNRDYWRYPIEIAAARLTPLLATA